MNPAVRAIGGSVIRELNARKKPTSIDLGLGEPTRLPDVAHFETATRWVAAHGCPYTANSGDAELRALIAQAYRYEHLRDAANVCVTAGSQEALYLAMKALLDPACDELLLVGPIFPVYEKIAQAEGIPVRRVEMSAASGFAFDPDQILAAVQPQTRMIVICSPGNPTGSVISYAAAQTISTALLARPGSPVYVLHDEVYRELRYVDDVGTFANIYPHTVSVNSLSKSHSLTGLRLGWIMAPQAVMADVIKVHAWTTSCASTFAQHVALEIFAAGVFDGARAWYVERRATALAAAGMASLDVALPAGAFYLCVDVRTADALAFAYALLETSDVVAIPGIIFGPTMASWLRTSFVATDETITEGLTRIGAFALACENDFFD